MPHTPEPWKLSTSSWDGTEYITVETGNKVTICMEPVDLFAIRYASGAFIKTGNIKANMNLIAVAPELLAVAKGVIRLRVDNADVDGISNTNFNQLLQSLACMALTATAKAISRTSLD